MKSAQAVLRPSGSRQIQGVAPFDMILTVIHELLLVQMQNTMVPAVVNLEYLCYSSWYQ